MFFYKDLGESGKRTARQLGLLFIVLIDIFALALIASYGFSAYQSFKAIRGETRLQIAVTGEGKVSAKPDVAKITATILTENEFLKTAQEENSQKSNVLAAYLKSQAIEEKDIRTVGYNIWPQYRYPRPCPLGVYPCAAVDEKPTIIGYQVRNSYEITIRELAKAGEILAGVVSAGANEVSGLTFTIDEPEALKAEARKYAIDDARAKAEKLAGDLGRALGKITQFSESGSFGPPIPMALAEKGGFGGESAPIIQPGENEIAVNVSITYEFK